VGDPKYTVKIDYVYADECDECEAAIDLIENALIGEDCVTSADSDSMFYLDNKTVHFCIDNGIDDIPSCIIGSKHKFISFKSFTKDAIKEAISDTKTLIDEN